MPLPDHKITSWAQTGGVKPFVIANVNPASLDLRVGNQWIDFDQPDTEIVSETFTIYPRTFSTEIYNVFAKMFGWKRRPTVVMATTLEWLDIPDDMAAMMKLKSTLIREGLGYPIADWIDPGYSGKLTLMLTANAKTTLRCGQKIVQIVLEEMERCSVSYREKGHYNNQNGPTLSWRRNNGNGHREGQSNPGRPREAHKATR